MANVKIVRTQLETPEDKALDALLEEPLALFLEQMALIYGDEAVRSFVEHLIASLNCLDPSYLSQPD